jgi:hypothetical protein
MLDAHQQPVKRRLGYAKTGCFLGTWEEPSHQQDDVDKGVAGKNAIMLGMMAFAPDSPGLNKNNALAHTKH